MKKEKGIRMKIISSRALYNENIEEEEMINKRKRRKCHRNENEISIINVRGNDGKK